ncbi:metal transporter CNNM3-like isoform X2 [Athene noctua]
MCQQPAPQHCKEYFSLLRRAHGIAMAKLSPQQLLTTQRFLVGELEFNPARISAGITQELKFNKNNHVALGQYPYHRHHPLCHFILILQGCEETEIRG